jgi:two-component sensor histidine kinase/PAS domain-containing protein
VADRPATLSPDVWDSIISPDRRQVLAALDVIDSDDDVDFDRLSRLAASIFQAPVALVTLVDIERQWFKSCYGLEERETPTSIAFCTHAIASDCAYLLIPDAQADARFADNPLVTGPHHVRFYAGAPITVRGQKLGTLCVLDRVARSDISKQQLDQLVALADTASTLFALKDEARVRARTAAELIREEWRHALTLEAGKVGSWIWDLDTGAVVANDILRRMFGIDAAKAVTVEDIFGAIEADHRPVVDAALRATFEDGVDYASEFRVRTGRWLMGRGRVYQRDASGRPMVMMGVNIDMTEAHASADKTRALLRELNHRVKNTLAMIQSLARQTLRQSTDPHRFIDAFSGRLRTLSDAHALLADRDWTGVGLVEVITSQVSPYATDSRQITLSGEDLVLPPDHALGLGLLLHELSSNAMKYGALSQPGGRVTISWSRDGGANGELALRWTESGGPPVTGPGERGLGRRLIERSLDKILGSHVVLSFPPEGVVAEVELPLMQAA